eukprot:TRINITY_DN5735_c0_g1_i3.p2 TRINITY_DN5735_c0_g1~~TRINITY_DN5735_c0_g1_i3.p2  ORF type:complete len:139 (+),score=29.16 TRINITY_DN5735_c0_g1_i3:32-448(+)
MYGDGQMFVYNTTTSELSEPLPHMPRVDGIAQGSMLLVSHNNVLYAIGCDKDWCGMYALQPSVTQWQRVCTTNTKHQFAAVGVIGNKIYISGASSTECYDTVTNKCVKMKGTATHYAGFVCTTTNCMWLVAKMRMTRR